MDVADGTWFPTQVSADLLPFHEADEDRVLTVSGDEVTLTRTAGGADTVEVWRIVDRTEF